MTSQPSPIATIYQQRRDRFAAAEQRCARYDRWLTHLRLVVFLAALGLFGLGSQSGHGRPWYGAGGLTVIGFLALVTYHDHVQRAAHRAGHQRQVNEQALARLRRGWRELPEPRVTVPAAQRALADDLDLFGHASLFHFLCSAHTPLGLRVLRDWLLEPAPPPEILRRQQALVELAPQLELRETFEVEGRLLADPGHATERFLDWAEGAPWLGARPVLLWVSRLVPATAGLGLLLTACGAVPLETGVLAVLGSAAVNLLVSVLFASGAHDICSRVNVRSGEVLRYLRMFEVLDALPASAGELQAVKQAANLLGGGARRRLRQLQRIASCSQIRHSALLFICVYLPLQFLFLYDFQVVWWLERWQRQSGRFARSWFLALGRFEALCSLARLVHDQPGWALPQVDAAAETLTARQLAHPLLPDQTRIANDVEVGPAASVLLVTGSNMSGKSTLLRAIGVNAVLAQAGAPVCAQRLVLPPVTLGTSMRVRDSLEGGVSFYMAELLRLKQVVDLARNPALRQHRPLLYLLDEILLGTNSRERHLAVVRVLQVLLESAALGAVSTHDLELASSEPLARVCRCVHFRETLHGHEAPQPMTFDYRLRPGVATTTNALKLLELVGLGPPGASDGSDAPP